MRDTFNTFENTLIESIDKIEEARNQKPTFNEVKDFVDRIRTWFEDDTSDVDSKKRYFSLITRRHGDVANDSYSEKDYDEGLRVAKIIQKKFPKVKASVYTIDEFVKIEVKL